MFRFNDRVKVIGEGGNPLFFDHYKDCKTVAQVSFYDKNFLERHRNIDVSMLEFVEERDWISKSRLLEPVARATIEITTKDSLIEIAQYLLKLQTNFIEPLILLQEETRIVKDSLFLSFGRYREETEEELNKHFLARRREIALKEHQAKQN